MIHKRKHARHILPNPVHIFNSLSGEDIGVLVNISQNGILIAGSEGLNVDSLYQLELRFPELVLGVSELSVGVDCLWVEDASAKGQLYWSGCQIIDISEEGTAFMQKILLEAGSAPTEGQLV
ncbi:MAG: PilZ domain-containing protein [Sinobacterium sp.]|nr:PilZ domain-containing protein [Sinobacterium sp.]